MREITPFSEGEKCYLCFNEVDGISGVLSLSLSLSLSLECIVKGVDFFCAKDKREQKVELVTPPSIFIFFEHLALKILMNFCNFSQFKLK